MTNLLLVAQTFLSDAVDFICWYTLLGIVVFVLTASFSACNFSGFVRTYSAEQNTALPCTSTTAGNCPTYSLTKHSELCVYVILRWYELSRLRRLHSWCTSSTSGCGCSSCNTRLLSVRFCLPNIPLGKRRTSDIVRVSTNTCRPRESLQAPQSSQNLWPPGCCCTWNTTSTFSEVPSALIRSL